MELVNNKEDIFDNVELFLEYLEMGTPQEQEKTIQLIKAQNDFEKIIPIEKMSNEKSWNTMLTYEKWMEGQRMSSILLKKR